MARSNGAGYLLVHKSIKRFGNKRTVRVGRKANERNDGLGQHHFLALGMRETLLQNIESNGKDESGKPSDTGWPQINRFYNEDGLKRMPAVKSGTWAPKIPGKSPFMAGYCPPFQEGLDYLDRHFAGIQKAARAAEVRTEDLPKFTLAAHNAGFTGALNGYHEGDVDAHTAGGEYSAWIEATAKRIKWWLRLHPNWRP